MLMAFEMNSKLSNKICFNSFKSCSVSLRVVVVLHALFFEGLRSFGDSQILNKNQHEQTWTSMEAHNHFPFRSVFWGCSFAKLFNEASVVNLMSEEISHTTHGRYVFFYILYTIQIYIFIHIHIHIHKCIHEFLCCNCLFPIQSIYCNTLIHRNPPMFYPYKKSSNMQACWWFKPIWKTPN